MTYTRTETHTISKAPNYERLLVRAILKDPLAHSWTLQGFGMLRLYLENPDVRLHIWDPRYKVEAVTKMHTHPWNLHSKVIVGLVKNTRFAPVEEGAPEGWLFDRREIVCGVGGHETENVESVTLRTEPQEYYSEGNCYTQKANEIHISTPAPGSVTIVRRAMLRDTEHAYVFTTPGSSWVSAEPRVATDEEIRDICDNSLKQWFA